MIFIYILIGIGALWALITGIAAISEAWRYCMIVGKSSKFFPHVFGQIAGNWIAVIGILVFCIPVWILLSITISNRMKNPYHRMIAKLASDDRYNKAIEIVEKEIENTANLDTAKQASIDYLIQNGISKQDADESISFLISIKKLSQIKNENKQITTLEIKNDVNRSVTTDDNKALEQLVINGEHDKFVKRFPNGWNHQDWLDFKHEMTSKYGNIDEHKLGNLLEISKK
ncbi:MAG: hypothetical protein HXX16_11405 [Bacteroidales bacterium]|nr:hypothetical protein [Bacteroidales bacterium]